MVQFTSTTDGCFYKNKCYSSNLICSKTNKLDQEIQAQEKTHTNLTLYYKHIRPSGYTHTHIQIYTPEVMLHLISKLKNSTCASISRKFLDFYQKIVPSTWATNQIYKEWTPGDLILCPTPFCQRNLCVFSIYTFLLFNTSLYIVIQITTWQLIRKSDSIVLFPSSPGWHIVCMNISFRSGQL